MSAEQINAIIETAYERLEGGDPEGALELGCELEALRHSSGFELQALAHAALGDRCSAIEVLKSGVEQVSDVWLLWQLLGNYQSDEEGFEEALASYDTALRCPNVDTPSVHYNIATVLVRQGRLPEALGHLDLGHLGSGPDHALSLLVAAQRLSILSGLGRCEEALGEAGRLITQARVEGTLDWEMAPILGEYAVALWHARADRDAAEKAAWETIAFDRNDAAAQWVLRELNMDASATGSLYRMLLVGQWDQPRADFLEPPGFHVAYEVVADSAAEAFELARAFEPPSVQDSLEIEEAEVLEPRPGARKGVLQAPAAYHFFPAAELESKADG